MDLPLDELEQKLEELARKWERYFAGDREVPIPPERERQALARQLRFFSQNEGLSTAARFRLDGLLHRFFTYTQLWERQLRGKVEARRPADAAAPATVSPRDEVARLHQEYTASLLRMGKKPTLDEQSFRRLVEEQRRKLEQQGLEVQGFVVSTEGGRVSLKAKARRKREGA
ncbi:MAG: hypothetical protein NZ869_02010 [Thermoanaerobaculum sp.]|nr:hypothetical protein [Thermoanaerobaculum sp.]MDW7966712.1 hypothetical protein [Thermoanaerobaculum sp.]